MYLSIWTTWARLGGIAHCQWVHTKARNGRPAYKVKLRYSPGSVRAEEEPLKTEKGHQLADKRTRPGGKICRRYVGSTLYIVVATDLNNIWKW